MFEELDTVALTRDVEEHALKRGDVGAVVYSFQDREAFEVEFVTGEGRTIALLTLRKGDIRPIGGREVMHVRQLDQAAV
jgi:hypothetical protein